SGSALIYTKSLSGGSVASMALDSSNNVYVAGSYVISLAPPPPPLLLVNPISSVGKFYLTAIASDGSSLLYQTYVPASARCSGCLDFLSGPISIAVDSLGDVYVAGLDEGTLPLVAPAQPAFGGGPSDFNTVVSDGFLMKIASANAPAAGLPSTVSFGVVPVGTS